MIKKTLAALAFAAAFSGVATRVDAQEYPTRPVTLLVGLTPGSLTDLGARLYAEAVSQSTGQRFVVENRAGAGGIVAGQALLAAPPDGYTLMITLSGVQEILPAMQDMPFDAINDFTYITPLFYNTTYMVVRGDMPANSIAELAQYGKQKPGGLNFGATTLGSGSHLIGVLFGQVTGVPVEVVAYRGPAEMQLDIAAGRLDFSTGSYASIQASLSEKKIKLLAINSPERAPRFPTVPTFKEAGFASIGVDSWFGIAAPAKAPKAVVQKIYDEFVKASKNPEVVRKLTEQDAGILTMTPEETLKMTVANKERLGKVIKDLGIKAN